MFSLCCGTCLAPEVESRLPQGPGGGRAGPVWLVLLVTEVEGPTLGLKQDLCTHGLRCPQGSRGIDHLSILHPEGLPPTQKSQRSERRPKASLLRYF